MFAETIEPLRDAAGVLRECGGDRALGGGTVGVGGGRADVALALQPLAKLGIGTPDVSLERVPAEFLVVLQVMATGLRGGRKSDIPHVSACGSGSGMIFLPRSNAKNQDYCGHSGGFSEGVVRRHDVVPRGRSEAK